MGKYATMLINGVEYSTKELFEGVDWFTSFGVRVTRRKGMNLPLQREGIQIVKYLDHDRAGGNYYYRLRYNNNVVVIGIKQR